MARPKRLTKAKIKPIVLKINSLMSEYISSQDEIEEISESIKEVLSHRLTQDSLVEPEIDNLSGVVDARNLASTGAAASGDGFHIRTKTESGKGDGIRGL